jgi:hypothetical protein
MREAVWAVNKQLVESPIGAASGYQGYTWHRRLLICLRQGTDGFNALHLRFDQGYGAACVLASINEWGECIVGTAATWICELLQFG